MSRDLELKIDTYADHFKKKIERLKTYNLDVEDRLLKKNILVSILDAISRATSNSGEGNRERFTGVVAHFGEWPDHSRVSAPHVSYLLRHLRSPAFQDARQSIAETIGKNSHGGFVLLSGDPELDVLKKLWPVPIEQKLLGQLSLSSFTHLNLLYHHRNSLVHELREPGYGMEFHEDHDAPFYHGMTTSGPDNSPSEHTLELVYPLKFFFRLAESVIKNVESYLRKNSIDPYAAYRFGSSWIAELNT
jgi:hypothetical protein